MIEKRMLEVRVSKVFIKSIWKLDLGILEFF